MNLEEQAREIPIADVASRLGIDVGRNGWACCPIHGEKTPSFHLRPAGNGWFCFGCQAGGDTLELVKRILGIPFPQVKEWFTTEFGLQDDGSVFRVRLERRERSARDAKLAAPRKRPTEFVLPWERYERYVGVTSYVLSRGLSLKMATERRLGHDPEMLRALWPVYDRQGVLRGVSGRLYAAGCLRCGAPLAPKATCEGCDYEQPSKWLHTDGLDREQIMYGEDQLQGIGGVGILMEGTIDRDLVTQYGFPNALATFGTNVAKTHIDKAVAWFDRLIVFGDGDKSGRKMSAEWKEICPIPVYEVPTPDGKDPGSLTCSEVYDLLSPAL